MGKDNPDHYYILIERREINGVRGKVKIKKYEDENGKQVEELLSFEPESEGTRPEHIKEMDKAFLKHGFTANKTYKNEKENS